MLDLLLHADAESMRAGREGRPPYPFFLILDEMNLAHVEHYFSDFLSAMESGAPIELHADAQLEAGEGADSTPMPRRITIPHNVYFTGTVNVDETTSMFSPKVLDRAFTIELDQVDLAGYGADPGALPPENDVAAAFQLLAFPGVLGRWQKPTVEDWRELGQLHEGQMMRQVVALHTLLTVSHRHFGFRVANEIARFVTLAAEQAGDDEAMLRTALDLALLEKVLPKFHGTQQELETPLSALFSFLVQGGPPTESHEAHRNDWCVAGGRLVWAGVQADDGPPAESVPLTVGPIPPASLPIPVFPRSAAKVWRMLDRLREQGFTSFIE